MSDYHIHHHSHLTPEALILKSQKSQAHKAMSLRHMVQVSTEKFLAQYVQKGIFNPIAMKSGFRSLESHRSRERQKLEEKSKIEQHKITASKESEETASRFQNKNPELDAKILLILRSRIREGDTKEDILRKVLEFYPDYSLADEALDFILETTRGELRQRVLEAKEELNARYSREIKAGRNISLQAREFSEKGLGSPMALRDMYRDITGNPREVHQLFNELTKKFEYSNMKTVIDFLLHSLGSDLKAKGPSISRAELQRLLDDTRTLQAILGVFFFFRSRMKLIYAQFTRYGLTYPNRLTFEILAKQFMEFIEERYLSSERVMQLGRKLGLSEESLAQVIIFSQMRDGIRQVSPRLYRSYQHRQEALESFIKALEELEDFLEENEEK